MKKKLSELSLVDLGTLREYHKDQAGLHDRTWAAAFKTTVEESRKKCIDHSNKQLSIEKEINRRTQQIDYNS